VFRDLVQVRGVNVQLADERESARLDIVRLFGPEIEGNAATPRDGRVILGF
jgi:hypothetical protein